MAEAAPRTRSGGARKRVCRLYLKPGSGKWQVNGRTLGDYFPRSAHVAAIQQPFTATDTLGRFDIMANVEGGGLTGQAGALRLAVARALVKLDEITSPQAARSRTADPRCTRGRAQEARPSEGTQEVPVLQALTRGITY